MHQALEKLGLQNQSSQVHLSQIAEKLIKRTPAFTGSRVFFRHMIKNDHLSTCMLYNMTKLDKRRYTKIYINMWKNMPGAIGNSRFSKGEKKQVKHILRRLPAVHKIYAGQKRVFSFSGRGPTLTRVKLDVSYNMKCQITKPVTADQFHSGNLSFEFLFNIWNSSGVPVVVDNLQMSMLSNYLRAERMMRCRNHGKSRHLYLSD